MPPAKGAAGAVVVLVLRDMQAITSTGVKWLQNYAKDLGANGGMLMLADVNPAVQETLRKSGALEIIGSNNVFGATPRVLEAENTAWAAAQARLARGSDGTSTFAPAV
jgi:SulP family sulfate permease